MSTKLQLTREEHQATICLHCLEGKPPTLDHQVLDQFDHVLDSLHDAPPRAVVVTSDSLKYFCVGANLNALQQINEQTIGLWVERGHDVLNRLADLPCPVIAKVRGYALGGGLELAMACDLIFAGQSAQLGLTEARLGFIPGWGGCRRLAERIGVARAKHLFFGGRRVDAGQAAAIGLIDQLTEDEQLDTAVADYVTEVAACSGHAVATFKQMLGKQQLEDRQRNRAAEAEHSVGCLRDPQTQQRLSAFFEGKR